MSGRRFNSRNAQQVPNAVPSSSQTPSFQPPSYYAAAAGLEYPPTTTARTEYPEAHSSRYATSPGMPLSYPTGDMGEDETIGRRGRTNSFSRPFAKAPPKQSRRAKTMENQEKRRSQMADLPFLETQLIPSLRDTIDRMTHPPRVADDDRTTPTTYDDHAAHTLDAPADHRTRTSSRLERQNTRSPLIFSPPSQAAASSSRTYPASSPSSPMVPAGFKSSSKPPLSTRGTPRLDNNDSVASPSRLPIRNASTIRAEAELSAHRSPAPSSPRSLRSPAVGSRREERAPQLMPEPSTSSKLRSPNLRSPSKLPVPGSSSTPDPGQTPRMRQPASPHGTYGKQSQAHSRAGLPRATAAVDSGSDIEQDYSRHLASERLIVANAEAVPSSSESEHDYDHSRIRHNETYPSNRTNQNYQKDRTITKDLRENRLARENSTRREDQSVGLGFRFEGAKARAHHHGSIEEDPAPHEDEQDYYERQSSQGRSHRNRDRRGSVTSESRRRREVLMGLVNGLQREYDIDPSETQHSSFEDDDQDDFRYAGGADVVESPDFEDENRFKTHEPLEYRTNERRSHENQSNHRDGSRHARRQATAPSETTARAQRAIGRADDTESRNPGGSNSRSNSLPPVSRSSSRPAGPPKPDHSREKPPEAVPSSRRTKARHRQSMSVDRTIGTPHRAGTTRSKRTSVHRDNPYQGRSRDYRKDPVAHEREAFGIPESLSYGGIDTDEDHHDPQQELSRSTSDGEVATVVGDEPPSPGLGVNSNGLSTAAEALFKKLSGATSTRGDQSSHGRTRRQSLNSRQTAPKEQSRQYQAQQPTRSQRPVSIAASASAPSIYEHDQDSEEEAVRDPLQNTSDGLRSTMRPKVFDRLLNLHGQTEMQRQEIIFELCRSQRQLVERLRSIVQAFILPLRRKHSKNWIPGIPTQVARLFDWLEDIVNLHVAITEALDSLSTTWETGDVITNIGKTLRGFVPRFEVYQPYLMRFEEVKRLIVDHVNAGNDFGEYVRIREQRRECNGWTLAKLLEQPVRHLTIFEETSEKLLKLTPSDHLDYMPSFSLYHSFRMINHVLWEVKAREEEYEYVKDMTTRLEGLLPSVQLASRERRLLWHGDLTLQLDNKHAGNRDSTDALKPTALHAGPYGTPAIILSPCPDDNDQQSRRRHNSRTDDGSATRPFTVHVLVLTDVLVIGKPSGKPRSGVSRWTLLSDIGMSRVVSVINGRDKSEDPPSNISLKLLPLTQNELHTGTIPDDRGIITANIHLPSRMTRDERSAALTAFRRCHAYTLRSVSFPSHSGQYLPLGPNVDFEQDTQKSVMAILNTGLPLPKSPSIQMVDKGRAGSADPANDLDKEREERGWWALRFQQVLREMQRQDPVMALQGFER